MAVDTPNIPLSASPGQSALREKRSGLFSNEGGDRAFYLTTKLFAASVLLVTVLIGGMLLRESVLSMHIFGFKFLHTTTWDPVQEVYGALPFIFGTLVTSFLA